MRLAKLEFAQSDIAHDYKPWLFQVGIPSQSCIPTFTRIKRIASVYVTWCTFPLPL